MNDAPLSDDFAVALGIKESQLGLNPQCEEEKWIRLKAHYIPSIAQDPVQQEIVFSRFGALYLPRTVQLWKSPPPASGSRQFGELASEDMAVYSAYDIMLEALQGHPYFFKFMRTKNPEVIELRKSMGAILARRLAARAPVWEAALRPGGPRANYPLEEYRMDSPFPSVDCATGCTQLLCTLLCYESRADLEALAAEPAIRDTLVPILHAWATRYRGRCLLGDTAMRCEMILTLNPLWLMMAAKMRKDNKVGEGLQCAYPLCNKEENLKKCSKCETAKYCSAEHQRAHWRDHKAMCFQTVF